MIDEQTWIKLANAAKDAASNAYAPYSNFHVGAALLAENGVIYAGCNVENASYGATSCAERSAIGSAITAGQRKFLACVVYNSSHSPVSPCGICRQVLAEFAPSMPIRLTCASNQYSETNIETILPDRFTSEDFT